MESPCVIEVETFSPLIIGEVPSTAEEGKRSKSQLPFSPLIIGEVPSTRAALGKAGLDSDLQSPHHRGGALNGAQMLWGDHSIYDSSVPSSSGRCPQPKTQFQTTNFFSPLIIGEVPSTPPIRKS